MSDSLSTTVQLPTTLLLVTSTVQPPSDGNASVLIGAIVGSILALLLLLALAWLFVRARRQRSDNADKSAAVDKSTTDDNEMVSARADDGVVSRTQEYGNFGTIQGPMSEYDNVHSPLN